MSNSLKSRLAKLEQVANPKVLPGIILFFTNAVYEEDEDGVREMVDADYYLKNDDEGEPLTDDELEKALEGKQYIAYLPVEDKRPEYHVIETDTQ